MSAKSTRTRVDRLSKTALPAIAVGKEGAFVVLARVDEDKCLVHDPIVQRPEIRDLAAFGEGSSGELIVLASRASLAAELAKFDFTWVVSQRR